MNKIFFLIFILFINTINVNATIIDKEFKLETKKIATDILEVKITPSFILPGRIYSLSFVPESDKITFPLPVNPSQKEKDEIMMLVLEETEEGLKMPFYKKGVFTEHNKEIFKNPFKEPVVTDINNQPIGEPAQGILFFMSSKIGKGVILASNTDNASPVDNGIYTVHIHFNKKAGNLKLLIGIVHVDIVNPSLVFPILSEPFKF